MSFSDGLYFYKGSDEPEVFEDGVPDGYPAYNIIADNFIDGAVEGMKMGETLGNEFYRNVRILCVCCLVLPKFVRLPMCCAVPVLFLNGVRWVLCVCTRVFNEAQMRAAPPKNGEKKAFPPGL